jgi:3-keto-5-aminohexanoate cleavage enzyme
MGESPIIVTATPNISWLHPEIEYPQNVSSLVEEAARCRDAGAAILHMHAEGRWSQTIDALRAESDLILQCGMSSLPIPERMDVFEKHADMISIILSHHDEAFAELDVHVLHPREELGEYASLSRQYGVKLELETWHTGSIWNMRYMIEHGLLDAPYFTSLFFGWPGGSWSPATIEEYRYRKANLPSDCMATVSIMGEHQMTVLAAAISQGDHVRVGTEDHPFDVAGTPAPTHVLVQQIAEIARALGRPVAVPEQAREMIGL